METRKLQQVGGGTFTVSIPKAWAREHGLEAGTTVNLYTYADGSIVVRSTEKDGGNLDSVCIDVGRGGADLVSRALRGAQTAGFETVHLVREGSFSADERRSVRTLVRRLVGTEIVEERNDELVVRNLLDTSDVSVRQSVVQLQFVALSMHRRATAAFGEGDGVASQLEERENEAERLFGMVARQFNRALISLEESDRLDVTRSELFDYYETAERLRDVVRVSVRLARVGAEFEERTVAELQRVADDAHAVVEGATTAVLDGGDGDALDSEDGDTLREVFDDAASVREDLRSVEATLFEESTRSDGGDAAVSYDGENGGAPLADTAPRDVRDVVRAIDFIDETVDAGDDVAEIALRAAVREAGLRTESASSGSDSSV